MMRRLLVGFTLLAGPLAAQDAGPGGARAELLRQEIEDRFAGRIQEELGLTGPEGAKLRETASEYARKRRDISGRERGLRLALAGQLRPGVAADQDSVGALTNRLMDVKLELVQNYREEMRELGRFLTPVQRAQFYMLRERLLQRVQAVREQRTGPAPRRGAGMPGARRP